MCTPPIPIFLGMAHISRVGYASYVYMWYIVYGCNSIVYTRYLFNIKAKCLSVIGVSVFLRVRCDDDDVLLMLWLCVCVCVYVFLEILLKPHIHLSNQPRPRHILPCLSMHLIGSNRLIYCVLFIISMTLCRFAYM